MLKVAIVGRVNVGKSTLFNALVGSSVSVVWKEEGTTRDVVEAVAHSRKRSYVLMDTAGYFMTGHPLQVISERKSDEAVERADIVIAVFDAKSGPTEIDWEVRDKVLRAKKPHIFVINKADNKRLEVMAYELFSNFASDFIMVSATTKKGLDVLFSKLDEIADDLENERMSEAQDTSKIMGGSGGEFSDKALILEDFSTSSQKLSRILSEKRIKEIQDEVRRLTSGTHSEGLTSEVLVSSEKVTRKDVIRLAFVGRPNVGKSSLVNAVLGYPRCIVYHEPGTTRDAVRVPFEYRDYRFVIVDTPGVRRRSRIDEESLEFRSVGRALVAMQVSDVSILVVDSVEGVTHQDKHLMSFIERSGTALVVALNKIDIIRSLGPAGGVRKFVKAVESTLKFINWSYFVPTSATERSGIDELLEAVIRSYIAWSRRLKPSELLRIRNRLVELDFLRFQNPKIFQVGTCPPTFLIYVKDPTVLRRYQVAHVEKVIRSMFDFRGSPIHFRIKRHGEEF